MQKSNLNKQVERAQESALLKVSHCRTLALDPRITSDVSLIRIHTSNAEDLKGQINAKDMEEMLCPPGAHGAWRIEP